VTRTEVDLIFTKAKPKFERRLSFRCFLDALSALAEKRYPDDEPASGLRRLLTDHLAPLWSIVQMEMAKTGETEVPMTGVYARLYDVRNYTGVYAERFRSGDGRINSHADNRAGRGFKGNTNTGTDEVIHNIASIMRPNLRSTGSTMPKRKAYVSCLHVGHHVHRFTGRVSMYASCVVWLFSASQFQGCVTIRAKPQSIQEPLSVSVTHPNAQFQAMSVTCAQMPTWLVLLSMLAPCTRIRVSL